MKLPQLGTRGSLLLVCFFLSGLAGLIYQTAWTQQFALVFGTSELALVTVLAAYMAGLALGAAAAGRWAYRVERPVLAYAVLELCIGVSALAVPWAITAANRLQVALLGSYELPTSATSLTAGAYYLASSFAILLIPTALMGATLPLLARFAVQSNEELGRRVGVLYAANTAGAAAGTLLAAFALLPRTGLGATIAIAVAVNLLVFALAAVLARGLPTRSVEALRPSADCGRRLHWILPLILISGAVSFTWEILWTRLLSYLLGGSVYAFATMLATFLTGLSLGSSIASRLATSREQATTWFAAAQAGIALFSLLAFVAVDDLTRLVTNPGQGRGGLAALDILLCGATLFPGAIAIGATFPLAVRILARRAAEGAAASARVFAWNTVGAITGALAAGYLALPTLRFAGTAAAAAGLSLAVALATALLARPRRRMLAAAGLVGLAILAIVRLPTPWQLLRHSPMTNLDLHGEVSFFAVGRSSTVLLMQMPSGWRLTTNGLPESAIDASWGRPGRHVVARWLSLLPLASRPATRSMLVVGLGAGVTVEDIPSSVEEVHVIELEPEVVRANRFMAERRRMNPFADRRVEVHLGDARGVLRLTQRQFDAIISQPSHPWTSGASHLFTREFFTEVRERLTPQGVFVQWMGLPFVDDRLLRSLVATAVDVFPHVEVYQPVGGAILILASCQPLDLANTAEDGVALDPREWLRIGVRSPADVLAARSLANNGARSLALTAEDGPSTDSRNLFRMRSPRIMAKGLNRVNADAILGPHDSTPESIGPDEALGLVWRLVRQGNAHRARRVAEAQHDPVIRQTGIGWVELSEGRRRPAEQALRRALRLDSRAEEAIAAMVLLYQPAISRGEPFPFSSRIQNDPAAALATGWRLDAVGDWTGVRRLEDRLAAIDSDHLLWEAATRLRVSWRISSGTKRHAEQAMDLLQPLHTPMAFPRDLLQRARAASTAGQPRVALATLNEVLVPATLRRSPRLGDQARPILESLPQDPATEDWRRQLLDRLE